MRRITGFLLFALTVALLPAAGVAQTESVLYNFCSTDTMSVACTDGSAPNQGVIQASDGNYYGTTTTGGANSAGTVFRLTPSGTLTTLYSFCASAGCADGSNPSTPLVEAPDGSLYGGTAAGGTGEDSAEHCENGCGVIYRLTLAGAQSVVYNFCQLAGCGDGIAPAQFVFGSDGNIYGVTSLGGPPYTSCENGCGEFFKLTTAGVWSAVYGFEGMTTDGNTPTGIVQGVDGNFYGTAQAGLYGEGSVFKMILGSQSLSILHSFCADAGCPDGSSPSSLVQAADGNLYGGTAAGGTSNKGTLFKVTTAGALTPLYSFCSTTGCGSDVANPMLVASDGNLYGTTSTGGDTGTYCTTGCGLLFELSSAGSYSALYTFQAGTADAVNPAGPLGQAANGDFYGTGTKGGHSANCPAPGCGAVYGFAPAAALAAPVQVSLSPTQIASGGSATLSWKSLNAFSTTMQQCYLYSTVGGVQTAVGKLTGAYNPSTHVFSGSTSVSPSAGGGYTYAVTCGGQESGSAALTVTGGSPVSTTTALTASPNPAGVGQSVTLTATVSHTSGTAAPTGKVTFTVGSTVIYSANVNSSGVVSFSASSNGLAPGSYPVVATYAGDSNYSGSSGSKTVVLNKATTTTTMTASPNPVTSPAACTLTATVKRSASSSTGYATGSVTFSVGPTVIATVNLNATGVAKLSAPTSGVPNGTYPVTAKYNGDSSDNTSTSAAVNVVVN
jgi:uncharacterized repeat protein (TIGR03803 family)